MKKESKYPLLKKIPLFENDLVEEEIGFEEVYKAIIESKPFYVVSGIRNMEKYHLGYKFLANTINSFIDLGGKGYIFTPDIEDKFSFNKSKEKLPLSPFFESFNSKVNIFSDEILRNNVEKLFYRGSRLKIKKFLRIFGLKENDSLGKIMGLLYSSSSYFAPNEINGTNYPTLVLGTPSHKSTIMFSREITQNSSIVKPSALLFKLIPGKDGSKKMSESKPSSCIYLEEESSFLKSITGGRQTLEEQSILGGNSQSCGALRISRYFSSKEDLERIEKKCAKGYTCSNCKKDLLKIIL